MGEARAARRTRGACVAKMRATGRPRVCVCFVTTTPQASAAAIDAASGRKEERRRVSHTGVGATQTALVAV